MITTRTSLGDLISALYEEFLAAYGDADLASVATAATINEMLVNAELDGQDVSLPIAA